MRIIYESLFDSIKRQVERAAKDGRRIESIVLTEADWRQLSSEKVIPDLKGKRWEPLTRLGTLFGIDVWGDLY